MTGTLQCAPFIAQFRRLLRQEGAFLHQNACLAKPPTWWIDELLCQITRQSHLQLRLERFLPPAQQACTLNHTNLQLSRVVPISLQTLHYASLQVVTRTEVMQGDTIGNVDINSEFAAALVATELMRPHLECNCKIQVYKCSCGSYHMGLSALTTVGSGDILCANTDTAETTIVQFDGSAHREAGIGGAGAALLQVGPRGYYLLKWGALSLYPCKDNIVAEAYGAELAITLYSEYVKNCRKEQTPFLPLGTIQGDIKPLIHHLQFAGRFRRSDLVEVIDRFHKLKSRVAPAAQLEYRPREANFLADFLAEEASGSLKGADKAPVNQPVKCCRLEVNMPYELLLRHQAIILGPHQYGRTVLALREVPSCPVVLVEKFAASQGNRQAALLRQLVTATQRLTKPLCVEYIAAAEDGMGRPYARQISAQSLTKEARYLLYGQNHKEVDMSGAHYELLRRCVGASRLPPIAQLREAIWTESQGIVQDPHAFAKHLPLRLLNTNAGSTLAFAQEQGYIPGGRLSALFWEIENLRDHHLPAMLQKYRSDLEVSFRIRATLIRGDIFAVQEPWLMATLPSWRRTSRVSGDNVAQARSRPGCIEELQGVLRAPVDDEMLRCPVKQFYGRPIMYRNQGSRLTLVKEFKFPQQSGCTMGCGSLMKSRMMPFGLRKLSLSDMSSQGSRNKNPFLKLYPWKHSLPVLRSN